MILCPLQTDRNHWNPPAFRDTVTIYELFPLLLYTGG
jgi:hypothetical protein